MQAGGAAWPQRVIPMESREDSERTKARLALAGFREAAFKGGVAMVLAALALVLAAIFSRPSTNPNQVVALFFFTLLGTWALSGLACGRVLLILYRKVTDNARVRLELPVAVLASAGLMLSTLVLFGNGDPLGAGGISALLLAPAAPALPLVIVGSAYVRSSPKWTRWPVALAAAALAFPLFFWLWAALSPAGYASVAIGLVGVSGWGNFAVVFLFPLIVEYFVGAGLLIALVLQPLAVEGDDKPPSDAPAWTPHGKDTVAEDPWIPVGGGKRGT